MKVFALTGGIATGKSTAARIMCRLAPEITFFDCDESVRGLLNREDILTEVSDSLGEGTLDLNGQLDRDKLRAMVLNDKEKRTQLESILHPKVKQECLEKLRKFSNTPSTTIFVADIPLLFESCFDFGQELNLVVATSVATQRVRLRERNHFKDKMITLFLDAQLPISEKVSDGDVVFWNEGRPTILERQLSRFLHEL